MARALALIAGALAVVAAAAQAPLKTFGTGLSQGTVKPEEQVLFAYTLSPGATSGALTQWWVTGGGENDNIVVSMYIDGEATPSIQFQPSLACGVGFDDNQAAWGNDFFGKQADSGGWYSNIRVPFSRSINITYQSAPGAANDVIYMWVRGQENLPVVVGEYALPPSARLILQKTSGAVPALGYVNVVDVPTGSGLILGTVLSFSAGNLNTLEGCHHLYTPYTAPYPGILLSTGTEDYFVSAYYFNAGVFHGPVSGLSHIGFGSNNVTLSAYRLHHRDFLSFADGAKLTWRNGDATDPATGLKCMIETGGRTVGSPTTAQVTTYAWVYVW